MLIYFTKHAEAKIRLLSKYGFRITKNLVRKIIKLPLKIEKRDDGTVIANGELNQKHILRVVYRLEGGRIIIITLYPGRRKAYGI